MTKPTALQLVARALRDAWVVDVRRGTVDGFTLRIIEETPASLRPGRYIVVPVAEALVMHRRLTAAEASAQLTRVMRRRKRNGNRT